MASLIPWNIPTSNERNMTNQPDMTELTQVGWGTVNFVFRFSTVGAFFTLQIPA
jgi:hypothetical protein